MTEITISIPTILKIVLAVIIVSILFQIVNVLAILFLAIVVTSALDPIIVWFKRFGIPRIGAATLIFVLVFFFLALMFYLLLPPLIDEISHFFGAFPQFQKIFLESEPLGIFQFSFLTQNVLELSKSGADLLKSVGGNFLNVSSQVFGGLFSFVLLIVISFYLSVQEQGITRFLRAITPLRYEAYVIEVWDRARKKLGIWLRAMFILMAIVGTLVYLSLTVIGIKFAFLLGVFAGLFEIIPVVGPIFAAVPGVILGLLQSPATGLMVLLVYIVVQQIENHVFVPLIMQKAIGLNPIVIIISLLIGGTLGGILGLLVAVPLATVIVEIIEDFDRRRRITA